MERVTILLADNDKEFLETRATSLENEGFSVKPAFGLAEATAILERGRVDLAVLDLRLVNDADEHDTSGLELAAQVAPSIPKIVLTHFPTYENVRKALGQQLDGLPPAVDFVAKQEGPHALITAIRKALQPFDTRFRRQSDNLALKIGQDYEQARQQARWNFWVSVG